MTRVCTPAVVLTAAGGAGRLGYAVAELAPPLLRQVDAPELHHLVRDGAVETPEGFAPVPQTQHALEVHQALVHAHAQQRPLTVDGEVLERLQVVQESVDAVVQVGLDVFVGAYWCATTVVPLVTI